jgi:hypothetical protein
MSDRIFVAFVHDRHADARNRDIPDLMDEDDVKILLGLLRSSPRKMLLKFPIPRLDFPSGRSFYRRQDVAEYINSLAEKSRGSNGS